MLGIRKGAHIGTNLRNNGRCRSYINARDGAQQSQCLSCFVISSVIASSTYGGRCSRASKCQISCEESCAGAPRVNRSRSISISSIRFRVCVFRHLSNASREILPYSMRWRMIFRPEAPNASDRNAVKRKPELCRNLSMRFFWAVMREQCSCDTGSDAAALGTFCLG